METRTYNRSEIEPQPTPLNLQERVLAAGMLEGDISNSINYRIDSDGSKIVNAMPENHLPELVAKFKQNTKDVLAIGRSNLLAIEVDKNIPKQERDERVKRYLPAFLNLQIKLDKLTYPPDDVVHNFVPSYIPDRLTDMGSDPRISPEYRSDREKIRVNKAEIFRRAKSLFEEVYTQDLEGKELGDWKESVVKMVAMFVYDSMPYNREHRVHSSVFGRSVGAEEIIDKRLAVCRHHALVAQVLLQSFGITSRLLKCDVDFGKGKGFSAHAANLVRIDHQWYLLDTTNPDLKDGKKDVFLRAVSDKDIQLNTKTYDWEFVRNRDGSKYKYRSRDNMYFKVTKD